MPGKVFISYKNTVNGEITRDAVMAKELYDALTENGIECFYSTDSLRERGASDYRAVIDRELDECCVLIVVATSVDNVDSNWVEYEWSGFQNDLLDGIKKGKLFSYIDEISPRDLPRALRTVQAFRKSECSLEDIVRHIRNAVNEFCPEQEKQVTISASESSYTDATEKETGDTEEADDKYDASVHEEEENVTSVNHEATETIREGGLTIPEEASDQSQKEESDDPTPTAEKDVPKDLFFQKMNRQETDAVEKENEQTDAVGVKDTPKKKVSKKKRILIVCACFLLAGLLLLLFGDGLSLDGKAVKSIYKMTYSDKMLLGTLYSANMTYLSTNRSARVGELPRYYQNIVIDGQEYELSLLPVIVAGDRSEEGDYYLTLTFVDRFGEKYRLKGSYTVSAKGDIVFSVDEIDGKKITSSAPKTLEYYLVCNYDSLSIASGEQSTSLKHDIAFRRYPSDNTIPLGASYSLKGKLSEGSQAYKNIDSIEMVFSESLKTCTVRFTDGSASYSATAEPYTSDEVNVKWSSIAKPYNGKTKVFDESGKVSFNVINNEPYGFTMLILDFKTRTGEALYYMDEVG